MIGDLKSHGQGWYVGTVKDLLLEYHQKYYDIDVAAVFDSAQKFVEQNATRSKRPALVLGY